jgi:hypothetical protein
MGLIAPVSFFGGEPPEPPIDKWLRGGQPEVLDTFGVEADEVLQFGSATSPDDIIGLISGEHLVKNGFPIYPNAFTGLSGDPLGARWPSYNTSYTFNGALNTLASGVDGVAILVTFKQAVGFLSTGKRYLFSKSGTASPYRNSSVWLDKTTMYWKSQGDGGAAITGNIPFDNDNTETHFVLYWAFPGPLGGGGTPFTGIYSDYGEDFSSGTDIGTQNNDGVIRCGLQNPSDNEQIILGQLVTFSGANALYVAQNRVARCDPWWAKSP